MDTVDHGLSNSNTLDYIGFLGILSGSWPRVIGINLCSGNMPEEDLTTENTEGTEDFSVVSVSSVVNIYDLARQRSL